MDTTLAETRSDLKNLKNYLKDKDDRIADLKKFEELYFESHSELKLLKNQPISRLATNNDANNVNTIKVHN